MSAIKRGLDWRSADLWYPIFFFLAAVAACLRFNPMRAQILLDDQIYFYIGERAASGFAPHLSEFDPKNALSMFLTAAFLWIGRHFGAEDLMSARAASVLAVAVSTAAIWIAAQRISGSRLAAHISAMIPLLFSDYLTLAVAGAQPKVFLILTVSLWLVAATMRRPFLAGVLGASCFLVWQPALLMVGVSAVAIVVAGERRVRELAWMLSGAAAAIGLYELYFWWHDALREQLYQSLVFAAVYKKTRPPFMAVFWRLFAFGDKTLLRRLAMQLFAAILILAPVVAAAFPRRTWSWLRGRQDRICLVLGAYASTGFCFVDYQGSPDRLFVLPSIAMMNGLVLGSALSWLGARIPMKLPPGGRAVVGHVAAVAVVAALLLRMPYHKYENGGVANQRRSAAYVGRILAKGKTIYAMGPLHLLAMNRANNFNSFGFYPIRVRAYLLERTRNEGRLLPLKDGRLPDVLLQSRMLFPPNEMWINRYYRPVKSHAMKREKVRVYVRRDDVKPPPPNSPTF